MKTCCGFSVEVPRQSTSNEYTQQVFLWINKKNNNFQFKKVLYLELLVNFDMSVVLNCSKGEGFRFGSFSVTFLVPKFVIINTYVSAAPVYQNPGPVTYIFWSTDSYTSLLHRLKQYSTIMTLANISGSNDMIFLNYLL